MSNSILCHMEVKKETPGKIVYAEMEQSPHFQTYGVALSVYVDKPSVLTALGSPDSLTMTLEPIVEES